MSFGKRDFLSYKNQMSKSSSGSSSSQSSAASGW